MLDGVDCGTLHQPATSRSRSIRVSDSLFQAASSTGETLTRSAAQQIEHWARIGQALERSGIDHESVRHLLMGQIENVDANAMWEDKRARQRRDREQLAAGLSRAEDMRLFTNSRAKGSVVLNGPY